GAEAIGNSDAKFPLTPALSLGRNHSVQPQMDTDPFRRRCRLPSPLTNKHRFGTTWKSSVPGSGEACPFLVAVYFAAAWDAGEIANETFWMPSRLTRSSTRVIAPCLVSLSPLT